MIILEKLQLIEQFLDAIWSERGLSQQTLDSYRYDLLQLHRYLLTRKQSICTAGREHLLEFLAEMRKLVGEHFGRE